MTTIEWTDGPGLRSSHARGSTSKHEKFAAELRKNPGKWAVFMDCDGINAASVKAYKINKGVLVAFRPKGAYEAYSQDVRVCARYVGNQDGESQ